ncbi:MAG TPA: type I-C CRISPR-associated protein Cas8c/Csd1 [Planctomycetaceae bacterium]|nr:type I-C CRISPR-associated protein Cas8c/Csd1 [Planctomycetaceae bacterium]
MMLHELVIYARREGLKVQPGFEPETIRWLLVFSPEAKFLGVQDLAGEERKSKGREFAVCPAAPSNWLLAGGRANFLVESLQTVVCYCKSEDDLPKASVKHAFFVDLLDQASSSVPELAPVAAALNDPAVLETIRTRLVENKAKPTHKATLAIIQPDGTLSIFVQRDDWHGWWLQFFHGLDTRGEDPGPRPAKGGPSMMRCFLSGELVHAQRTHNKIKGLADVGGQPTGDVLAGFDKDAFASFGLKQGANAAMSQQSAKVYSTALNHLIRHRSHRLAGTKIAYWYSGHVPEQLDALADVLGGIDLPEADETSEDASPSVAREKAQAMSRARAALDAIRTGKRPDLAAYRYYALTLSANAGRVVVRDWMEGSFEELVTAVNAWFDDLAIVHRQGQHVVANHKFAAVLAAPLRDLKDASAPLTACLWRSAVKRQPIPHEVMAQTLARVRIDLIQGDSPRHARLGLLKAFCNRNERTPNMKTSLDEFETHPAYLCGRIMAILGQIQYRALGDVGAGVIQRYYAAASATPALVLGRLIRTAQIAHLPKIESPGLRQWFQNQLTEVWSKLSQPPPSALTLEEQTLFAMGYYHQSAHRSEAKDAEAAPEEAAGQQSNS